jgi:hypothetical protein
MNIVSHMFSGIIILKILNLINPDNYIFSTDLILLSMFFSILPDFEGLWSKKKMHEHHETPFHTTLFWMTIAFIMLMINFFIDGITIYTVFLLIIMVLAHLCFDYIFGRFSGVPILQPFTSRQYSLFEVLHFGGDINPRHIHKKKYKKLVKTYFENKILIGIEVSIWVIGIILLIFK